MLFLHFIKKYLMFRIFQENRREEKQEALYRLLSTCIKERKKANDCIIISTVNYIKISGK